MGLRAVVVLVALAGAACERVGRADVERTPDARLSPARPVGAGNLDAASLAVLQAALESKDIEVRLIAVQALGETRATVVLPWLEHALGDPEHDVRMVAVEALRTIGAARAGALLQSVRDDATEELDIRALAASALLGPEKGR